MNLLKFRLYFFTTSLNQIPKTKQSQNGHFFHSTTTTTTTAAAAASRRSNTSHHYPPPTLHSHPLDYFPSSYPAPLPPYPAHSPPSPHVYHPFYDSDAYSVCNHGNPFVGQPYFGPLEWQPPPQPPSRVVTPPSDEQKTAKVVNSEVNVHKGSLRLESDDLDPDRYLVSFVFDALLDGSITIYYFAKEQLDRIIISLFPETYVPIKVPFRKGLNQEFRQPSGTGIDFRFFTLDNLSSPSSRDDVFPIVISAETYTSDYIVDDRSYIMAHEFPQMQISQIVVGKNHEEQFTVKVIRQLLWTGDICYELKEIYGLGKSSSGTNENGSGKDCVICMTEPKDIAVLPCRHMCMCRDCAKALSLQSNKCPICREIIEGLLEIKIDNMDQ